MGTRQESQPQSIEEYPETTEVSGTREKRLTLGCVNSPLWPEAARIMQPSPSLVSHGCMVHGMFIIAASLGARLVSRAAGPTNTIPRHQQRPTLDYCFRRAPLMTRDRDGEI